MCQHAAEGGVNMLSSCVSMSGRYNAVYGIGKPSRGMMRVAVRDASVGGCANAMTHTRTAAAWWHACRIRATTHEAAQEALEAQVRRTLQMTVFYPVHSHSSCS